MDDQQRTTSQSSVPASSIQLLPVKMYGIKWRLFGNLFQLAFVIVIGALIIFFWDTVELFLERNHLWNSTTDIIPLLIGFVIYIGLAAIFMPLMCGNLFLHGKASTDSHFMQVTFSPRRYSGLWGLMDDADDTGFLKILNGQIFIDCLSSQLAINFADVMAASSRNIGIKGSWILGNLVELKFKNPMDGIASIKIMGRYGNTLFTQRKASHALIADLKKLPLSWQQSS
jgi:hypothetical protein